MMKQRLAVTLTIVVLGPALLACRAEVLSFSPDSGTPGADEGAAPGTVAALTDDQAQQLCQWIFDQDPDPNKSNLGDQSGYAVPAPGYVSGPGFGCVELPLNWILLTPDNCVLNLRHSDCLGAVAALQECVTYGVAWYDSNFGEDEGVSCSSWAAACLPFTSAPNCAETVFQTSSNAAGNAGYETGCFGGLPIEAGATCPGS